VKPTTTANPSKVFGLRALAAGVIAFDWPGHAKPGTARRLEIEPVPPCNGFGEPTRWWSLLRCPPVFLDDESESDGGCHVTLEMDLEVRVGEREGVDVLVGLALPGVEVHVDGVVLGPQPVAEPLDIPPAQDHRTAPLDGLPVGRHVGLGGKHGYAARLEATHLVEDEVLPANLIDPRCSKEQADQVKSKNPSSRQEVRSCRYSEDLTRFAKSSGSQSPASLSWATSWACWPVSTQPAWAALVTSRSVAMISAPRLAKTGQWVLSNSESQAAPAWLKHAAFFERLRDEQPLPELAIHGRNGRDPTPGA
jgi:hypothetical protein